MYEGDHHSTHLTLHRKGGVTFSNAKILSYLVKVTFKPHTTQSRFIGSVLLTKIGPTAQVGVRMVSERVTSPMTACVDNKQAPRSRQRQSEEAGDGQRRCVPLSIDPQLLERHLQSLLFAVLSSCLHGGRRPL